MSGNWMWAAKCVGEGARLVEACDALCKALADVGCAIDGGKDSLSMAAKVGDELVKIGDDPADVEDMPSLAYTFSAIQKLIIDGFILSAHDVSDGGFITALLEMSFAGNVGIRADIKCDADPLTFLFAEEAGVFLEVEQEHSAAVVEKLNIHANVLVIGEVLPVYGPDAKARLRCI
ncbi:hypothetical protein ANCDUO_16353 [Ancylostoma duodenale]|uniref:Uncharacterized protein n=1 Tax=Ancylostoma duodenale TaxID=51022 RepID=A0A0C2CUM0_9BILA|nr:hypothetical protein ANCDUO_16353 [Ancylostoma duodenale]